MVSNGEGYHLVPLVDLEVFRHLEQCMLPGLVGGACGVVTGRVRHINAGSSSTSCLTSPSSSSYLHPLGRVGRQYGIGIFIVLLDGHGQLIDQHDSIFTCELKSCQVGRECGSSSMPWDWSTQGAENG